MAPSTLRSFLGLHSAVGVRKVVQLGIRSQGLGETVLGTTSSVCCRKVMRVMIRWPRRMVSRQGS